MLETCLTRLRETIELDTQLRHRELYKMEKALVESERLLHEHLIQLLESEQPTTFGDRDKVGDVMSTSLTDTAAALLAVTQSKGLENINGYLPIRGKSMKLGDRNEKSSRFPEQDPSPPPYSRSAPRRYYKSRSAVDKLLFRLIVTLQLCLVRIEDAFLVISRYQGLRRTRKILNSVAAGCTGLGVVLLVGRNSNSRVETHGVIHVAGKAAATMVTASWAVRGWNHLWMTSKLMKSTASLLDWQHQWLVVQAAERGVRISRTDSKGINGESKDIKSQRLLEYTINHRQKASAKSPLLSFLSSERSLALT